MSENHEHDAAELIALHQDGHVAWTPEGLGDALRHVGRLVTTPLDDWTGPREMGPALLEHLRQRDPEAGADAIISRLVRFTVATEFIEEHAEALRDEGLLDPNSDTPYDERLLQALATLRHPAGSFILDEVLDRVAEL